MSTIPPAQNPYSVHNTTCTKPFLCQQYDLQKILYRTQYHIQRTFTCIVHYATSKGSSTIPPKKSDFTSVHPPPPHLHMNFISSTILPEWIVAVSTTPLQRIVVASKVLLVHDLYIVSPYHLHTLHRFFIGSTIPPVQDLSMSCSTYHLHRIFTLSKTLSHFLFLYSVHNINFAVSLERLLNRLLGILQYSPDLLQ